MVIFFVTKFQVFKVSLVQSDEEKDSHKLEVEHSKLLIRKMNDKENAIFAHYSMLLYFMFSPFPFETLDFLK